MYGIWIHEVSSVIINMSSHAARFQGGGVPIYAKINRRERFIAQTSPPGLLYAWIFMEISSRVFQEYYIFFSRDEFHFISPSRRGEERRRGLHIGVLAAFKLSRSTLSPACGWGSARARERKFLSRGKSVPSPPSVRGVASDRSRDRGQYSHHHPSVSFSRLAST